MCVNNTSSFFRFVAEAFNVTTTGMQVRVTRTDVSQEWRGWGQTPVLHVNLSLGQLVDKLINY